MGGDSAHSSDVYREGHQGRVLIKKPIEEFMFRMNLEPMAIMKCPGTKFLIQNSSEYPILSGSLQLFYQIE